MTGRSDDGSDPYQKDRAIPKERLVYVVPPEVVTAAEEGSVDLRKIWSEVAAKKWVVLGVTLLFGLSAVTYSLLATEWYSADVLLAPAEERASKGLVAQLGGLASLAGLNVSDGGTVEPIAVLKSREFTKEFIEDLELVEVIFSDDWNEEEGRWKPPDPADWPDVRDAVEYFGEKIRTVREDPKTGLVTLTVRWKSADMAAEWANLMVQRLNARMRERALKDAEENLDYLQSQLPNTREVVLQESIGRLIEAELQKIMLARGSADYSFRIIDPAEPPKHRSSPKRTLISVLGFAIGGMFALFAVIVSSGLSRRAS